MPADLSLTFGSTTRSTHSRTKTALPSLYNDFPLLPSQDTPTLRGGSPSSTMTVRIPDASPRVPPPLDVDLLSTARMLHRRSSRLSRWLSELQTPSTEVFDLSDVDPVGTRSNPYLAYPHLNMPAIRHDSDDADSIHDYVVVDDDIALECPPEDSLYDQPSHESAPTDLASPRSTIRLINPPHSLRHFHLSRRSVSPHPTTPPASRSPSRISMFHRPSGGDLTSPLASPSYHSRNTSLQTSLPRNFSRSSGASRVSSWRWRPSVLGHFSSASIPDTDVPISSGDLLTDRSRQSMSSSNTCSSITTPTTMSTHDDRESPAPSTPPSKPSSLFGSWRLRSHAVGMVSQPIFKNDHCSASSPSLRPLYPVSSPHLPQRPSSSAAKSGTIRLSFSPKSRQNRAGSLNQIFIEEPDHSQPHVLFAGKHGHRLSLSSLGGQVRQARRKKLVVSGIALNDTTRVEAIQRWCQSFGEIDQITRMPNGDIQISFLKADVADTVCRVRAQVQIPGAGSVHLSWVTGNKRT
ncbi:hypothetical protein JVU11DRAFT_4795 [Chiua virens]|nr:hypothetical protein JVU11DRAFT_4795 [Chiua virens]